MKGKFITFEGSEGCGKSTQSKLLAQYLRKRGYAVVYLREPGGVKISEKIRGILLDPQNHISQQAEMLLYMAARAEVVQQLIQPALKAGKIVICDRFLDSTIAYQGYGLKMDIDFIQKVGDFVSNQIEPGLTILMDLPLEKGLKHREFSGDRIEKRPLAYHVLVRRGYLQLAKLYPQRIKIVKVEASKSQTQRKIRDLADKFLHVV
jgi:dTMP kinase